MILRAGHRDWLEESWNWKCVLQLIGLAQVLNLDEIWTEAFGNVYNVNTTVARPGECRISTNHSTGEVQAFEEMSTKAFQPIAAAIQGTFLEV